MATAAYNAISPLSAPSTSIEDAQSAYLSAQLRLKAYCALCKEVEAA
jgi:hypothetical protein